MMYVHCTTTYVLPIYTIGGWIVDGYRVVGYTMYVYQLYREMSRDGWVLIYMNKIHRIGSCVYGMIGYE